MGAPTLRRGGGCQHKVLPNCPKNCMIMKEFGPGGGTRPKFYYVDPPLLMTNLDRLTEDFKVVHFLELCDDSCKVLELVVVQYQGVEAGQVLQAAADVCDRIVLQVQLRQSQVVSQTLNSSQLVNKL